MAIKKNTFMHWLFLLISSGIISCQYQDQTNEYNASIFFSIEHYNYLEVANGLRMAYLDLGHSQDKTILLLHGEPSSSFVYRNIAPTLCNHGYRVIIPDLVGFGYSDKPNDPDLITYLNHTKWLSTFIDQLALKNINLYAHDWGAMIALRIIAEKPYLFDKIAISYGYLHDGTEPLPESFLGFMAYASSDSNFSAGNIMDWGSYTNLPDSIKIKYNEPFKVQSDYYAVRKFPSLIPDSPNEHEALLNKKLLLQLRTFNKPFVTIWGDHKDQMWNGKDTILQKLIPGASHQKHFILKSNHFIQEDQPEALTTILLDVFK